MQQQQQHDDFAEMEALVLKTAHLQQKRQDQRTATDGEMQITGVFKGYLVYDSTQRKNLEQDTPPVKLFKKTLDGKSYPAPLTLHVQVLSLNHVPHLCEPLPNGDGWRVLSSVSYNKDTVENPEPWLKDHSQAFFDGKYEGSFPIGEYINEEGSLAETKWVNIYRKSIIKIKISDTDENIFRRHIDGKSDSPFIVGPFTGISFFKCTAEQFVSLRKENETSSNFIPVGYTSFKAKGVQLAEDHDANMPLVTRLHHLENKDVHNMIPIEQLRAGHPVKHTAYFWACNAYNSQQPCATGVSIYKLPTEELKDLLTIYEDQPSVKHTLRLSVFQWEHNTSNKREMYSVKILANKGSTWRNYGITDPQSYAHILFAQYNIPCHVSADLWKGIVLSAEANNPEVLNNKEDFKSMRGYYTYEAKMMIPDFIYYYTHGLAHRITKERVEREFKRFVTVDGSGEKEMRLKPVPEAKQNPLNTENPLAVPVFAIGNGQVDDVNSKKPKPLYHAFDEDLFPLLDEAQFFVLTSHRLTYDELQLVQDPKRGDEFLDQLIEKEKVYYWIYGIKNQYASPVIHAEKEKAKKEESKKEENKKEESKKRTQEEEGGREEEHVSIEPETPAKKTKKNTTTTTGTKKK